MRPFFDLLTRRDARALVRWWEPCKGTDGSRCGGARVTRGSGRSTVRPSQIENPRAMLKFLPWLSDMVGVTTMKNLAKLVPLALLAGVAFSFLVLSFI